MYIDSDGEEGVRVSVKAISEELGIDKTEARNLFEYLESKRCLKIETLGGNIYTDMFLLQKKDWRDLRNKKGPDSEPFKKNSKY